MKHCLFGKFFSLSTWTISNAVNYFPEHANARHASGLLASLLVCWRIIFISFDAMHSVFFSSWIFHRCYRRRCWLSACISSEHFSFQSANIVSLNSNVILIVCHYNNAACLQLDSTGMLFTKKNERNDSENPTLVIFYSDLRIARMRNELSNTRNSGFGFFEWKCFFVFTSFRGGSTWNSNEKRIKVRANHRVQVVHAQLFCARVSSHLARGALCSYPPMTMIRSLDGNEWFWPSWFGFKFLLLQRNCY